MSIQTEIPALESLDYLPYLNEKGEISEELKGKIGAYAIFNQAQVLQFVGYSRNIYLGLKQGLVCQPEQCYWVKTQTVQRPSRTLLEEMRDAWIAENQTIPVGNEVGSQQWNSSIDVKPLMTSEEQKTYEQSDDFAKGKLLKTVARRLEADIKDRLQKRGVTLEIRFNPKLKEKGILTLN